MGPLDGVTVFLAIAQKGSFSAAAESLGCSKSTVSERIARLEQRISARLFRRTARSAALTEAGRAYLSEIDDILDRVRKAEKAAQAEAAEPRGVLRISVPAPFATTHLAPLLPEFMAGHPDLAIDLQVTAEVVDLIGGGFDLAIRLCPANDPGTVVRRLGSTRLVLAASPALIARWGAPAEPGDLTSLPCLANSIHPHRNEWRLRCGVEERRVPLRPCCVANSHELLHRLALGGAGVAALSEYAVLEDLIAGRLVRLLAQWQITDIPVLAVYPDSKGIAAKVRVFVEFLAAKLRTASLVAPERLDGHRTPSTGTMRRAPG